MYPANSKVAADVSDKITGGINTQVGGTASATRARIAAVDATLLNAPTGVLSTDLATARNSLVDTPGATLESDSQTLNTSLNGIASGSSIQARIGNPAVNGTASNLMAVIGGSGSDLASSLGDPVTGNSGLSALTNASAAIDNNSLWNDISGVQNATTVYDQLNAFLALFNTNNWSNPSATSITFTLAGPPTSLGDLLSSASSTS
jgi:hypothetical protein